MLYSPSCTAARGPRQSHLTRHNARGGVDPSHRIGGTARSHLAGGSEISRVCTQRDRPLRALGSPSGRVCAQWSDCGQEGQLGPVGPALALSFTYSITSSRLVWPHTHDNTCNDRCTRRNNVHTTSTVVHKTLGNTGPRANAFSSVRRSRWSLPKHLKIPPSVLCLCACRRH
jgi:hypothetical protein